MSQTLDQIIGAQNLTGVIQGTTTGIPDVLPSAFYASRKTVNGDTGEYIRVTGNRRTAKIAAYGSPSQQRELKDIATVPVKLIHTIESIYHNPAVLINLRQYDNLALQQLGKEEVARQTREFRKYFDNLRVATAESALFKGKVYFDGTNLLASSSGAVITVDYGVPAGNQGQLNVDGGGNIFDVAWTNTAAKLVKQVGKLKKAARKLTGYPLKYAFYGENVPDMVNLNTTYRDYLARRPEANATQTAGEIFDGFCGLTWLPAYEAFFEDNNGTNQDLMDPNGVVFTPAPSSDWFEWLEGTYPLPTSTGAMTSDAVSAMNSMNIATGMFSYGKVLDDPSTIKQVAGDTFLPVLKVGKAVFQSIVDF